MSRRVAINLVAFLGVFIAMLWWATNNIIDPTRLPVIGSWEVFDQPYEITADFAATVGVTDGSEVAFLGVNQGEVRGVEMADDGRVVITMAIDKGKQIPVGSTANILRKSAVGEPYIDFLPPGFDDQGEAPEPTEFLQPGDHLSMDDTTVPLEFAELLRSASSVLEDVDPDNTRILIHELAAALDGRSETLRSLTVNSNAVLQTFADRADLLDSLSSNSTDLTRLVAERRDDLSQAITNLADLGESLRTIDPDVQVLLDRGQELLGTTADLVADVDNNLDCVFKDLDDIITVTSSDENLNTLERSLYEIPESFAFVASTLDEEPGGAWLRVHLLLLEPENPPSVYVPHTELPAVPEVPACTSALASSGVRYDAGTPAAGVPAQASLPATGTDHRTALLLVVVAGLVLGIAARRRATP